MSGTRKRRGTTLVELSLVIAILAMIALPFAAFVSQNLKNTVQSSTQLKEQMVLEQVMQDMEKHLRSAVRVKSDGTSCPITFPIGGISFTSSDPLKDVSTRPTQMQYTYVLASGLLTKTIGTNAGVTFPDGLEAGLITKLKFWSTTTEPLDTATPEPPDATMPPCYVTVRIEAYNAALQTTTALQKTIYLRNYTLIVDIAKIGVTAPVAGDPLTWTIDATTETEYTGTISWTATLTGLPVLTTFAPGTLYTATITLTPRVVTLTPRVDYTLTGVAADFFTVAGATTVSNLVNSGVVTAVFPSTETGTIQLTITGTTLTLSKPYDGNTTATVTAVGTLSGVVVGDTVTVSAVATYDTATVGTGKTITVVYMLAGADAAKYIKPVDYTVATGVITAKALTVTATVGQAKIYGAADPTFAYTFAPALVGSDVMSGALSRATGENVGTYAITQGTLTAGTNYTITFVSSTFSVTAKSITVTATAGQSKIYGAGDPTFAYTFAPALVGSDVMSGALSRATGENVGTYAFTLGSLTAGPNYTITFVSSTFSVTAKSITAIGAITGKAKVGEVLTAGALTPSGATATYQWQWSATSGGPYTDISGATSNTYTPVDLYKGGYIKVVATGTGNYSGTVTSAPTDKI